METLSGKGALLGPAPSSVNARSLDPDQPCEASADPGQEVQGCVSAGGFLGLTEKDGQGRLSAIVFRRQGTGLTPVLSTHDDNGDNFSGMSVGATDVTADGVDDLVFGFRSQGTGQFLSVDIVSAGTVVGHVDSLHKGVVRIQAGALDIYQAIGDGPECCPTAFAHGAVSTQDESLVLAGLGTVSPDDVPAGTL